MGSVAVLAGSAGARSAATTQTPIGSSTGGTTQGVQSGSTDAVRLTGTDGRVFDVAVGTVGADGTVRPAGYVRDATGATYAVVRRPDGRIVRVWITADSPLVSQIPWTLVNSAYTLSPELSSTIPLDDTRGSQGQLMRVPGDPRILTFDAATGQWRHVPDLGTLQAAGLFWCNITTGDVSFLAHAPIGAALPSAGTEARGDYPLCGPRTG